MMPSTLDYRVIGCARCHTDADGPLHIILPPPLGSLDPRDDVRVHDRCYWEIVNVVREALGFPLVPLNERGFPA